MKIAIFITFMCVPLSVAAQERVTDAGVALEIDVAPVPVDRAHLLEQANTPAVEHCDPKGVIDAVSHRSSESSRIGSASFDPTYPTIPHILPFTYCGWRLDLLS